MFKKRITFKLLVFLVLTDILETFTHFCFKKGAMGASELDTATFFEIAVFLKTVLLSPFVWIGILSVFLTFIIWSTILSKIDLSVAVPVCSFSYILVPLTSVIFLHEQVSFLRWLGIIFILLGVIFVSLSSKEREAILP